MRFGEAEGGEFPGSIRSFLTQSGLKGSKNLSIGHIGDWYGFHIGIYVFYLGPFGYFQ
jgi:hypothetical protein